MSDGVRKAEEWLLIFKDFADELPASEEEEFWRTFSRGINKQFYARWGEAKAKRKAAQREAAERERDALWRESRRRAVRPNYELTEGQAVYFGGRLLGVAVGGVVVEPTTEQMREIVRAEAEREIARTFSSAR